MHDADMRALIACALGPREVRYLTTAPYKVIDKIVAALQRASLVERGEVRWEHGAAGRTIIAVVHDDEAAKTVRVFISRMLGNQTWDEAASRLTKKSRAARPWSPPPA